MQVPPGKNSAQKICAVLRTLAALPDSRLTEVAARTELSLATASRILNVLCEEGFVSRHARRYRIGAEALAMAASASRTKNIHAIVQPSLLRLAGVTEDTAQLIVRSGVESVCLAREIGPYPIKNDYLEVGSRRPLGVGGGSMALLAFLSEPEIDSILEIVELKLASYPKLNQNVLRHEIAMARNRGYTVSYDLIFDKLGAIGVPVFGGDGRIFCALSVASLSDRLREREAFVAEHLKREATLVAREITHG